MAETRKDFAPIQADYEFFLARSTEADADLEAHLEGLRGAGVAPGPVRVLDFGCGPGTFTDRFLARAGWPAEQLELSLVEPVGDYRRQAVERLRARTGLPIVAWEELPPDVPHRFDLALSNHAFYYVPDPRGALARIARALRPGATFMASIAGRDNALVQFWFRAFPMLGRPVPYHTAEGFEESLRSLGLPFSRRDVDYELTFADSEQDRRKILRFLLGEYLDLLPAPTALGFFDPYATGGRIAMATRSYQYCVRCPE